MAAQNQGQQRDNLESHRHEPTRPPWIRWLIVSVALLLIVVGVVLWILDSQGPTVNILPILIFTVLGVVIGLFQWLFPISSGTHEHSPPVFPASLMPQISVGSSPVASMPPIIVHVPSTEYTHTHPQASPAEKTTYRGIRGVPPPTDPRTIQQREKAVKEIYAKLTQPDISAVVLTGMGGVGKSTLAALVYRYAEEQRRAGSGPFTAEPIWLSVDPAACMTDLAGNLFEALGKPLPDFNNLALQNQAMTLFNALNTPGQPRLVILDQFENLLDWQTGHALADRPGVGEWLDAINSQPCTCRLLLTSRPWPLGTREYPPTWMQEYFVKGLELTEGIELLRKLGIEAPETDLRTVVEHCQGHAFALTLLASFLRSRSLSLSAFFKDTIYPQIWTGNVARNLLDNIYKQQLNEEQRKLLLAFSVYRKPVHLSAAQALLDIDDEEPKARMQSALDGLLTQHLLQAWGEGHYQLHSIVIGYAKSHFVEGGSQANRQALQAAHARAAQHYVQYATTNCPPRDKRRQISDIEPFIEAIWQYCQAEQWQEAHNLMEQEEIYSALKHWGGNAILLELYQLLLPPDKWHAQRSQEAHIYTNLGVIYRIQGQMERAQEYLERALHMCQEEGDHLGEASALSNLGRVYADLGDRERARQDYEQSLRICQEEGYSAGEGAALNNLGYVYIVLGQNEQALSVAREAGDRKGEGWTLNNLGKVYRKLGQDERALTYLEGALSIRREVDRRGEGRSLKNLGTIYDRLGQKQQALKYYKEALHIGRELEDREGEGKVLRNIGMFYFDQHRYDVALAALLLARDILDGIQSPYCYKTQRWIDTLQKEVGEGEFGKLLARVEPGAAQIVEQALREG